MQTANKLASDQIIGSPHAADLARLADWLVQHGDLMALSGYESPVISRFFDAQAKLFSGIRNNSRLAPAMLDGDGYDEHVLIRGSPKAPGELVRRRFLEALTGGDSIHISRGSGRLQLAFQLTDPIQNPLLARVMVNRGWHHLFGRGIVASTDNLGSLGERPTHPELLDYLADRFVQNGWSIKRLVRSLVLSSAYRMSSKPQERAEEIDPENLLLHRMRLRRLEGEAIRDAMLAISGRINQRLYGPSVLPSITAFQEGRGRPESGPLDGDGRRSLYLTVRRNFLSPLLLAFDTPIPFSTVGRRSVSSVPAQALILMNDPFVHQLSELWGRQVHSQCGSADERIQRMFETAFARCPSSSELARCHDFLKQRAGHSSADGVAAWTALAHVLINVKEFVFLN
jgi:hypothetical protein